MLPVTTPCCEIKITNGGWIVEAMNLHGNVLMVVCNQDGSATIFGEATIDGSGSHTDRIDVQDNAEPGKGMDRYRMRVNAYDSGDQLLRGGNVQIHKTT